MVIKVHSSIQKVLTPMALLFFFSAFSMYDIYALQLILSTNVGLTKKAPVQVPNAFVQLKLNRKSSKCNQHLASFSIVIEARFK